MTTSALPSVAPLAERSSAAANHARLTPRQLKSWIDDGAELALLDVREKGVFSRGHLLLASNAPLWRIELVIGQLVPRRSTRIVLVDLDESLVPRAAEKLAALGYTDVAILAGGTAAWQRDGFATYTGVNVVGKAFGEVIEEQLHTPHIDVHALQKKLDAGANMVVVDGRTPEEFQRFSLPFAHNIPNGELVYRIAQIAPDPATLIVVNCAGRTRSILGAQTLINADIENPVVALQDGTMAWLQAGNTLRQGAVSALHEPSDAALAAARQRAAQAALRAGVQHIDTAQLDQFAEDTSRSLYKLDVRTASEYAAGHLPDWRWVPGGQLIQGPDLYLGTHRARVVIADWDGVRAQTSAAWLAQLGDYDVFLYKPSPTAALALGRTPGVLLSSGAPPAPWLSAAQLAAQPRPVFDVDSSLAFATRHIDGARFSAPDRLPALLADLPLPEALVITSADGVLAQLVASELRNRHGRNAYALSGGNEGWFALGLPTGSGRDAILTDDDDDWYSPYSYPTEAERQRKMREYLDWEVGLAARLAADSDVAFRLVGA